MGSRQVEAFRSLEHRIATGVDNRSPVLVLGYGFVLEVGVFEQIADRVKSITGDAAFEPEGDDVLERLLDGGVVPIQIGLLHGIAVIKILSRLVIPFPRRVSETSPVVRWLTFVRRGF